MTRIAIIGAGAIGGSVAAALGNAGHDVELCVRSPFEELQVQFEEKAQTFSHRVLTEPTTVQPADWLLLCTKAHQTAGAANWFSHAARKTTTVVVLQNGVEHESRVRGLISKEANVLPCVVRLPATAIEPGHIVQNQAGRLQVPRTNAGSAFAKLFEGQKRIVVEPVDDFTSAAWDKLVRNAVSGLCAIARQPMGILAQPARRGFIVGLVAEIKAVGEAEGAVFSENLVDEFFAGYAGPIGQLWTSIAKDCRDGRSMEWDARNAVVGRLGRKHEIATPLNDTLTTMLELADVGH
ncbi:MAG: 2-dehydropantoate 2-reductase [Planctomycetaceae bacterium]